VRTITVASVAVASVALIAAQPLSASPPKPAQGTEVTTFAMTTESRWADGNLIEERIATRRLTGSFTGTLASQLTRITYKDGDRISHGFETCDPCTVEGRTGTIVFSLEAKTTDRTVVTVAHLNIVDATGGLEGLHGMLEVTGNLYTGDYHFDPA
jgi:hypothetical protein